MKDKIREYLAKHEINVIRWEGEEESLVAHIDPKHNEKIAEIKNQMEEDLHSYVELSDMFGMNVLMIEPKDHE